jgi:two-component system, NtrC family, nitrogen regulation sensor histidine kinase GlnL
MTLDLPRWFCYYSAVKTAEDESDFPSFAVFSSISPHATQVRWMKRPKDLPEHILASLSDGVVALDPACRIAFFNPAMEEMTGVSSRRAIGRLLATLLPKESPIPARVVATLETGHPFFAPEAEWQRWDGQPLPTSLTISSILDKTGETLGAVLVVRDQRRIKELEESQRPAERLTAFGVLAAAMAHEIKNPLLGIRGAAQLLREELTTEEARDYTDIIIREADRLNALMEEMLDFARPHSLTRTLVNLHEVLDNVIALERPSCHMHGVSIRQQYDPSLPDIWADRNHLTQVFLNLMRNAWEAMPHGGTITVTTGRSSEPIRVGPRGGPMLMVELTDEGVGIPAEVQEKLFTPFFTTKPRGSGLGLAIAHKIIEEHGGRFAIKSPPGQGTTVRVYLPVNPGMSDELSKDGGYGGRTHSSRG